MAPVPKRRAELGSATSRPHTRERPMPAGPGGREARGSGGAGAGSVGCGGSPAHAVARRAALPHTVNTPTRTAPYVRCGAIHMQFTCQAAGMPHTNLAIRRGICRRGGASEGEGDCKGSRDGETRHDPVLCGCPAVRKSSTIPRKRQLKLRICFGDATFEHARICGVRGPSEHKPPSNSV